MICLLNISILRQILSHLLPNDLLNLARTTKSFRALLMSRSSENVLWRASRKRVDGLPEYPPFMSEPAYANFLFGTCCDVCYHSSAVYICFLLFSSRYESDSFNTSSVVNRL